MNVRVGCLHRHAKALYIDTLQGRSADELPVQTIQWPINKLIDEVQIRVLSEHSS